MTSSARHTDFLQDQFWGVYSSPSGWVLSSEADLGRLANSRLACCSVLGSQGAAVPALCPRSPPQRLGLKDGAPVVLVQLARLSGWSPGWISWLDWGSWIGSQDLVGQGMENRNDGRTALKGTRIGLVFLKEQSVAIVPAMGVWRERQGLSANPCCS